MNFRINPTTKGGTKMDKIIFFTIIGSMSGAGRSYFLLIENPPKYSMTAIAITVSLIWLGGLIGIIAGK